MSSAEAFLGKIVERFQEVVKGGCGEYVERICAEYSRPATLDGIQTKSECLTSEGIALRELLCRLARRQFLARLCRLELSACRIESDFGSDGGVGELAVIEITFDVGGGEVGGALAGEILSLFAILQSRTKSGIFHDSPFYSSGIPDIFIP